MEKLKIMRYVYDEIEEALRMSDNFVDLFKKEGLYNDHFITYTQNGRFMVNVRIKV